MARSQVGPLATQLGLKIDTKCHRDDPHCVADAVQHYQDKGTSKSILICWEHHALTDIIEALGIDPAPGKLRT